MEICVKTRGSRKINSLYNKHGDNKLYKNKKISIRNPLGIESDTINEANLHND